MKTVQVYIVICAKYYQQLGIDHRQQFFFSMSWRHSHTKKIYEARNVEFVQLSRADSSR